jgi:hypothetical protein
VKIMDQPPDERDDSPAKPDRHEAAIDQWLRDEVMAGHQEYLANPSKGIPVEDILKRIKARRAGRRGAGQPKA